MWYSAHKRIPTNFRPEEKLLGGAYIPLNRIEEITLAVYNCGGVFLVYWLTF